jgi:RNA polymerase sigma-70 factor (ECF subfamily)
MAIPPILPDEFELLIQAIRPELHRYVTRMVGSAVDAEDVVQDTLVKAHDSLALLNARTNVRGWLFRIAHNKAIDYLRGQIREPLELLDEYPATTEPDEPLEEKELAAFALSLFIKLVPRQRSCVVLKDIMGYSLAEISELLNATVPEIKAALHRGRTRLRELGKCAETAKPNLDDRERVLLEHYVERFNARDFDTLRDLLTDDVQLDIVGVAKRAGREAISKRYFGTYKFLPDWILRVGQIDGQWAVLVYDASLPLLTFPVYFVLLDWQHDKIARIRDYRFARYVIREAQVS